MHKMEEINACLRDFPKLDGKNLGLFYSGGLDSQTLAALLLKKGHDLTLITVDNGANVHTDITKTATDYLNGLEAPGKIKAHATLSAYTLFQEIAIRRTTEDVVKYGADYTCIGCKLSMLAAAIAYSKENGINVLLDGFVKAQEFYPEQTKAYIDFVD